MSVYFKIGIVDNDSEKMDARTLSRDESIVIYASDEDIINYIQICQEIIKENSKLEIYNPPIFASAIDGWLGYGMEPGNHLSFNQVRGFAIEDSLRNLSFDYILYILTNSNVRTENGDFLLQQFQQKLAEQIFSYNENFDKNQIFNSIREHMSQIISMYNNKETIKFGEVRINEMIKEAAKDTLQSSKITLTDDFYVAQLEEIKRLCERYDIDPNNFSLNLYGR